MKIISASVKNFGSYKELDFNFQGKGLTLISGPTGSGKSTLCDVVPWILFGRTAKGGSADEVISWNAEGPTDGRLVVEVNGKEYGIRRIRGGKSNDLFFYPNVDYGVNGTRGKDLLDTQKLINELLGMTIETYQAGSYLHENSLTSQFFTTTAKNRRQTTEQLVDLSTAVSLLEKVSAYTKELKADKDQYEGQIALLKNTESILSAQLEKQKKQFKEWEEVTTSKIEDLEYKIQNFNDIKNKTIQQLTKASAEFEWHKSSTLESIHNQIERLKNSLLPDSYFQDKQFALDSRQNNLPTEVCEHCGSTKDNHLKMILIKDQYALDKEKAAQHQINLDILKLQNEAGREKKEKNPYTERIESEKIRENGYIQQLENLNNTKNPYADFDNLALEIDTIDRDIQDMEYSIDQVKEELSDLDLLSDVILDLRGMLIKCTVTYLESITNKLLENHFDAELRVSFSVADADKLEVEITKDGNLCSYYRLSKGQSQLLKLAFGVAVMKAVSNHNGVQFNTIFLDEVVSGLDETMKAKAFSLLETLALEYENIFVIDHSEGFKTLFNNRIDVELTEQGSICT